MATMELTRRVGETLLVGDVPVTVSGVAGARVRFSVPVGVPVVKAEDRWLDWNEEDGWGGEHG